MFEGIRSPARRNTPKRERPRNRSRTIKSGHLSPITSRAQAIAQSERLKLSSRRRWPARRVGIAQSYTGNSVLAFYKHWNTMFGGLDLAPRTALKERSHEDRQPPDGSEAPRDARFAPRAASAGRRSSPGAGSRMRRRRRGAGRDRSARARRPARGDPEPVSLDEDATGLRSPHEPRAGAEPGALDREPRVPSQGGGGQQDRAADRRETGNGGRAGRLPVDGLSHGNGPLSRAH